MDGKLKIAIATGGRFHVLDLARELKALGHEVVFYSYVPVKRAVKFGLPAECQRSMFFPLGLFPGLIKYGPGFLRSFWDHLRIWTMDWLVARRLEPCDVFIGMSQYFVAACRQARGKYGAKILVERGSTHILRQKEVLAGLKGGAQVPDFDVKRELASYEQADLIVIPSLHVEDSFLQNGFKKEKLFRNPYGVNLEMFTPTPAPDTPEPTVLFVGGWTYRKGCELWSGVLERLPELRLIHVGGVGDAPMPASPRFTHVDPVDQWELQKYYAQAHVFALASREEGLSLVLCQALACGLPLVCSDQTGGRDLLEIVKDENLVRVFPVDDLDAFCRSLETALAFARGRRGMRVLPEEVRRQMTWRAYGERYSKKLVEITGGKK
jgi:alpha-maltose-1-phosphate synthase